MSEKNKNHAPGNVVHMPWLTRRQRENELYRGAMCALIKLGVPMHLIGFEYLANAITLTAEDPANARGYTTRLYPKIAENYGSEWKRVERDIRSAIERTFENGNVELLYSYFGNAISDKKGKVSSSVFISRIAADVRLDVMDAGICRNRKRLLAEAGLESAAPDDGWE